LILGVNFGHHAVWKMMDCSPSKFLGLENTDALPKPKIGFPLPQKRVVPKSFPAKTHLPNFCA